MPDGIDKRTESGYLYGAPRQMAGRKAPFGRGVHGPVPVCVPGRPLLKILCKRLYQGPYAFYGYAVSGNVLSGYLGGYF